MSFLNADIPVFEAYVRNEFLYDMQKGFGEFTPVAVFGVCSRAGWATGFHVMTERGAQVGRLPIHSLAWKKDAPTRPLDALQLWDSFSDDVSVHEYGLLARKRCRTLLKDSEVVSATYLFTFDWTNSCHADGVGDLGWKCGHFLKLDDGNFAIQPNNRILWYDPAFVANPYEGKDKPDYLINTHEWICESTKSKYVTTENSDRMFYDVKDNDDGSV
jgi:hypothetical protein